MQKFLNNLRRTKIVICRSHPLVKVVALCAVVLSTVTLLTLRGAILESENRTAQLLQQADALEQENQDLEQYIDELGTVQGIQRIAEEELGLVDPDTVIIEPQQ
ncbi:MAG: hypothetical protein IKC09_04050 [Oscillospiraceae bacterium]|nr:hypothetical protein [Oscillospiraceae bacterium]